MKLDFELTLNAPRDEVWDAFVNPDNLPLWQPSLVRFEHLTGTLGQPGSTYRAMFTEGRQTIEMTETIDRRREPEEFVGHYETTHGTNTVSNRFESLGRDQTRWVVAAEFQFRGLVRRLLSLLLRGMFRQRLQADLSRFQQRLEAGEPSRC